MFTGVDTQQDGNKNKYYGNMGKLKILRNNINEAFDFNKVRQGASDSDMKQSHLKSAINRALNTGAIIAFFKNKEMVKKLKDALQNPIFYVYSNGQYNNPAPITKMGMLNQSVMLKVTQEAENPLDYILEKNGNTYIRFSSIIPRGDFFLKYEADFITTAYKHQDQVDVIDFNTLIPQKDFSKLPRLQEALLNNRRWNVTSLMTKDQNIIYQIAVSNTIDEDTKFIDTLEYPHFGVHNNLSVYINVYVKFDKPVI